MLDIHVGITDPQIAQRALASLAPHAWIKVHQITDATNIYDLRKRGYAQGESRWVSFLDQDDELVSASLIQTLLASNGEEPFFTNSQVVTQKGRRPLYPAGFKWEGLKSYVAGKLPHNGFFMTREIANEAIDAAYARILSSDERFLNSADTAVAFEIQMKYGWRYADHLLYRWYNDSAAGTHNANASFVEVVGYYIDLMKKQAA